MTCCGDSILIVFLIGFGDGRFGHVHVHLILGLSPPSAAAAVNRPIVAIRASSSLIFCVAEKSAM